MGEGEGSVHGDKLHTAAVKALVEGGGENIVMQMGEHLQSMLDSAAGRRAAAQLQHDTIGLSSQVLGTIEAAVLSNLKASINQAIRSNALGYLRFFGVRAAAASVALHLTKAGVRRLSRRFNGPRCHRVVTFAMDIILPSSFFGPVLGIAVGVVQLTSPNAPALGDASSDSSAGEAPGLSTTTAELLSALLQAAGAAGPSTGGGLLNFVGLPMASEPSDSQ